MQCFSWKPKIVVHISLPHTLTYLWLIDCVITVKSLNAIYHEKLLIKNTDPNTDKISLPCASTYCLTAPEDWYNYAKPLCISTDTSISILRPYIFLPLCWQSLPPILLKTPRRTLIPGVKSRLFFLENVCLGTRCQVWESFVGHFLFELSWSFTLETIHRRYTNR